MTARSLRTLLEQLIDNRMWLHVAKDMGLSVSDEDLRKAIMQRTEFHGHSQFDLADRV